MFGNRRITAHICVRINKAKIIRVTSTTFVGVVIDDKLNWKSHMSNDAPYDTQVQ